MSAPVPRLPTDTRKKIGRVEHPPLLLLSQPPLDVETVSHGQEFNLPGWIPEREGTELVCPLGKGLQVRHHPVDRPIQSYPLPFGVNLLGQLVLKRTREPRRPGGDGAALPLKEVSKQSEVSPLHLLRRVGGRDLDVKVIFNPPPDGFGLTLLDEEGGIISSGDLWATGG